MGPVLSARGLTTYYVLFFIELATRAVRIAGITTNPRKAGFFKSLAMSAMSMTVRYPKGRKLVIDRDAKYLGDRRKFIEEQGVEVIPDHTGCWGDKPRP